MDKPNAPKPRRNCWQVVACGREAGGKHAAEMIMQALAGLPHLPAHRAAADLFRIKLALAQR